MSSIYGKNTAMFNFMANKHADKHAEKHQLNRLKSQWKDTVNFIFQKKILLPFLKKCAT